jgi:enamine deaminase RidA (YjgF/YER057c/UK114 family)
VVRTVQQTTPATRRDYGATAAARRELLGPDFPASTGVLTPALPHADALVALEVWASTEPKEIVNPGWAAYDQLTFSPAVRAGNLLFISGTTAWNAVTGDNEAPGDIGRQAEFVYEQIGLICEAAGGSLADVVKTVEYVTPAGVDGYRAVADVRRAMLPDPLPASTGVVVSGLLSRQWLIEVEALAVLS